ncbi:hybrid sensor histidine kinase/response regulator [Acinetobacter sp. AM]|uniref:hybrid sensor histidine kinase/response regulator n=1 Tax=Acinetobacter sp. AM TaxID=2170730 RepID=UPI000DE6078B|nr:Hpt domain-containing protein [Acinetobacter sp. AM]PWB15290.1 hybrid sensor histidine kinase/response regulator [Acinetobacter sp. AM]
MKEILKNLVDTTTLPEDSYLEQDAEILEIFVEEIEEIFEELDTVFEQWLANPSDQDTLTTIRRHFHTLKGSGRMVGAKSAGEVAWAVEDTLNRVIFGSVPLELKIQKFAETVYRVFQFKLYPQFKSVKPIEIDLRPLVLLGQELQQGRSIEPALEELLSLADRLRSSDDLTGLELGASQVDIVLVEEELSTESSDLQEETTSIFIEEAEEHLATIDHFLKQEAGEVPDYNGLIRALHTLRGSSSMAHIQQIFDASSKVENLFKTLLQEEIVSTSNETVLLIQYAEFVRDFLHILRQGKVENLSQVDQTFNQAWENYGFNQEEFESSANPQGLVSQLIELDIDLLLDAELEFEKRIKNEFPTYVEHLSQKANLLAEHTNNRASQGIHDFIQILDKCYQTLLAKPTLLNIDYAYELFAQAHQEFIYLFDTLAAGQRISLSAPAEQVLQNLTAFVQQDLEIFDPVEENLSVENASELEADLTAESGHQVAAVNFATLSKRLHSDAKLVDVDEANRQFDEDLLDIFLEEADELLMGMDQDVHTWSSDQSNTAALNNLMRYLHTLKGGANMIQATHIGLIAHELETIYERIINQQIQASPALIQIVRLVQDNIADRIQTIREEKVDYPAPEAIDILNNIQALVAGSVVSTATEVVAEQKLPAVEQVVAYEATTIEPPVVQPVHAEVSPFEEEPETSDWVEPVSQSNIVEPPLQVESLALDESVRSIVEETFYEEAAEIFDTMEKLLRNWSEQRSDRSLLLQLQRAAHSLKGGARMAEIEPVGAIAYRLESAFEQFAVHHFNSNVYDPLLQTTITWLRHAIFDHDYTNFDSLKAGLEAIEYADVTVQLPSRNNSSHTQITAPSFEFIQGDGAEPPAMMGEWESFGANDQSNEMIRISADLIEKMIDLSGENSINRSRIEMDLGQLGNTLNEMELAIKRLADQLRRMEGELESQIIAKHGSEVGRYADFDPLEMDQYSSLNQLSKSLAESASDLVDFKSTLAEKIRDTEGLLLQQSRIQAEIQEGLMRTRLVPFSRLLPRLQRIVRQTASTLNRPAELIVNNTEGELDRTILERLVTPLEHMLRNAVDHGIEDPAQRQSANKPEIGKIELNISRQGTDVVVEFHDDGKGIDVNRIKEKAMSLGLMKADQLLEKEEILQFIFHPGFSTAQQITQISGRGVGLDVVQSSIKALGGHVTVDSTLGKGTSFSIRVPTTVAVSDALMVKSGDQQFALPLAHIERIVRIAPATLETYFNSKEDYFKIDNQSYKLRYISEFVSNQPLPRLSSIAHSLPVLLIKGNSGQTIALLVDQLIGSRAQIVVKPIGQQFAAIGAITGATILGDGQVCLILDGQNIARQVQTTQRVKHGHDQRDSYRYSDTRRLIMIVDDSVTVRKVTSRLLERQGYDVVTAKDGVDAIEQLENVKPDLMLLDIEMPRMDGFEVTNLVRHHEVHKQLPIIMITSRTGEKHRERAFSLGVTHYMGKPFQEAELLNNIESLLTVKQG